MSVRSIKKLWRDFFNSGDMNKVFNFWCDRMGTIKNLIMSFHHYECPYNIYYWILEMDSRDAPIKLALILVSPKVLKCPFLAANMIFIRCSKEHASNSCTNIFIRWDRLVRLVQLWTEPRSLLLNNRIFGQTGEDRTKPEKIKKIWKIENRKKTGKQPNPD